jgi:hypothetical protein
LNAILAQKGKRATFVTSSGCPPLLGVASSFRPECVKENLSVREYLRINPDINTVVMAAYWPAYFRTDELTATDGAPAAKGAQAASNALTSTIHWLRDNGKQVVLIGPVPTYDKSVPLALAQVQATGHLFVRATMNLERLKNSTFFSVVEATKHERSDSAGSTFSFLDPIQWMCTKDCMVMKDGVPLYRDSHHLSVAGAMTLEPHLSEGLTTALAPPKPLSK